MPQTCILLVMRAIRILGCDTWPRVESSTTRQPEERLRVLLRKLVSPLWAIELNNPSSAGPTKVGALAELPKIGKREFMLVDWNASRRWKVELNSWAAAGVRGRAESGSSSPLNGLSSRELVPVFTDD